MEWISAKISTRVMNGTLSHSTVQLDANLLCTYYTAESMSHEPCEVTKVSQWLYQKLTWFGSPYC